MQPANSNVRIVDARRLIFPLVLASAAFITILAVSLRDHMGAGTDGLHVRHGLVWAVAIGTGMLFAALVWQALVRARRALRRARQEAVTLRHTYLVADAIVKAEPHVLVLWEQAGGYKVVAHNLRTVPGLPEDSADFVRFDTWLETKSAEEFEAGLAPLTHDGRPFNLLLKTEAGGHLEADGRTVGEVAVLRFRAVARYKSDLVRVLDRHEQLTRDLRTHRALLDALPMPVWMRGAGGRLEWANTAYVRAVEAADAAEVRARQIELLESRQRASLDRALAGGEPIVQRRHLIVGGELRPHDVIVVPQEGMTAAAAIDVTALETAQGELDRQIAAYDRTLDRVATAVAIFGPDQRLAYCNEAYRRLWQLEPDWLSARPSDSEVLDRLQALSKLPDVVDYRAWKSNLFACYRTGAQIDDWWHLPDGRSVHVFAEQRPDGGVAYLYDDATEKIALESRYNALIGVQRETLNNLKEGVAVFGPDGRLKLFNAAFETIWQLSRDGLLDGPHIEKIMRQTRDLCGESRTWARLAQAVTAISDEREPMTAQTIRPDGRTIAVAASPLSDGATLLTFSDMTDTGGCGSAPVDRMEAAA
ncbi:MAG: PAS-domain containing protein [Hyphomicrobiaceae bacterium]